MFSDYFNETTKVPTLYLHFKKQLHLTIIEIKINTIILFKGLAANTMANYTLILIQTKKKWVRTKWAKKAEQWEKRQSKLIYEEKIFNVSTT